MGEDGTNPADQLTVVGIGASAGGLESLERFFEHVPADTGMAFVVLQHLSPDFKSLMDELLGRRTRMPVRAAEHDTLLEPNCVYLLPPMKEMTVERRRLQLSDKDPRHGLALPIDTFFRSLARDIGERAIAVVLSGSGSDGSRGIVEISRAGGIVFCESAETAKFNGMPLSAMRTGAVDRVMAPEEIAGAIGALARGSSVAQLRVESDPENASGVDAILQLLRDEYAIDFSHYKTSTVVRRIERRLALNRSVDIDMYVDRLRSDPRELNQLYEDLLIGVTRFFRDDESFALLEQRVIPEVIARAQGEHPNDQIRVWVAGCATGQEAYSIAMLFHEQLAARGRAVNLKMLATDVHRASLEVASAGVYTKEQVVGVSPERLSKFFTLRHDGYHISQNLRESIVFAPHNVIRDAPFTKLDLVACRNMLIYLQPHAQKTVLALFHFALRPGGYLFLGSSESPGGLSEEFETIDEHAKVYRKKRDIGLPRDLKLPIPRSTVAARLSQPTGGRAAGVNQQLLATYDRLLDRFMPPSFLVDEQGQLLDTYGGLGTLLRVKPRRPSHNLLDMLDDDLRTIVAGVLHRVRRDVARVEYANVQVRGLAGRYRLVAEPLRDQRGSLANVLLSLTEQDTGEVMFSSQRPPQPAIAADRGGQIATVDADTLPRDEMRLLQDELSYTKENLQSAIQELETTNEELQATNEELIASNEELQSTNEELHSVNEELYTVNAEYQKKNAELQELNDDMEHLLNGTDVGTMFLDRALCIRKFTPRIADTFKVIAHDIGRPLHAFSHNLRYPSLMADVERTLADGTPIETSTTDNNGRSYFLRILPYRGRQRSEEPAPARPADDRDHRPDGVVLTLTDITPLEQARSRLAQLSAIVESSDDAITSETVDGAITSWNDGATRLYGYTAEEVVGRDAAMLFPADRRSEAATIRARVREGHAVEHLETVRLRKDGSLVDVLVTYSLMFDASNRLSGVSAISRDITPLVRARQEIADREERIRLLLDSTAEAIYGIDLSGVCTFCNAATARLLGYQSPQELIGRSIHGLIHHTRRDGTPYPPEQSPIFAAMRNREQAHVDDEVLWRADGTRFDAEYWSHPIIRNGEVIGAVVTFLDITERRKAEGELQDAVRLREQFLAMLSHELRNPLAAILSATHLLESGAATDEKCQEAGRVVARQARHMARLLDDLLDVSRITHGRIVLRKELVDLRETSRSAIEALGPLMAERRTVLRQILSEDPLPVIGDPARLQQIQANLLSNASKYSPEGGVVRFEALREGDMAVIRVSDNGRGIEPEVLPRIFDLFVQGPRSLDRAEGGLGIGLTLLRSLVELHDGEVEAHSDGVGHGSVFTVRLPLASEALPAGREDRPRGGERVRTVVVVEDQEDSRLMMQILLESKGLAVHTAENGDAGVELIERVRPDVALVDLGLPIVSGYELARRVRQIPSIAHTRLIALSGYGQESDIRASLDAGFDAHLTKPPDFDRLDALLTRPVDGEPRD